MTTTPATPINDPLHDPAPTDLRRAPWWDEALAHLAADPVMDRLIRQFPGEALAGRNDPFQSLAQAVVAQQVSTKSAQAVWTRLQAVTAITPAAMAAADPDRMGQAGVTRAKQRYLKAIATAFLDGSLDPMRWASLDDAAVAAELRRVPGIGPWTAQMLLIFHLQRPDILPLGDVGLLRAVELHYGVPRAETPRIAEVWAPFRSAATWYLWRSLDPEPIGY